MGTSAPDWQPRSLDVLLETEVKAACLKAVDTFAPGWNYLSHENRAVVVSTLRKVARDVANRRALLQRAWWAE